MRRRVEGIVSLEAIIYADGTVGPVRVVKPLHLDLDQEAVSAVKQWRFTPAQKEGQAIASRIEVEMSFRMKQ